MNDKNLYNYTKTLKEPMKIRRIKSFVISKKGITVTSIIIGILLFVLFFVINKIIPFANVLGVIYYVIPLLLTYLIVNINPDGKNILLYLYDYFIWKISISSKKRVFSYDEQVLYRQKNIRFR